MLESNQEERSCCYPATRDRTSNNMCLAYIPSLSIMGPEYSAGSARSRCQCNGRRSVSCTTNELHDACNGKRTSCSSCSCDAHQCRPTTDGRYNAPRPSWITTDQSLNQGNANGFNTQAVVLTNDDLRRLDHEEKRSCYRVIGCYRAIRKCGHAKARPPST